MADFLRQPSRPYEASRPRWALLLALTTLLALALRLYRLDSQSVWYDEIFSLSVSRMSFPQMMSALVRDVVHPPLHYVALHWWFQIFGFGPLQGRLLSALYGTLAVVMIFVLAKYLFDYRTALLACLLLAFSQLAVSYSQEARPYAQFLCIFLICVYFFLRSLREQRLLLWILFVCAACALIYTHYYGFLVLVAVLLFTVIFRKRYSIPPKWLLSGATFLIAAYLPWICSGIVNEVLHGTKVGRPLQNSAVRPPVEHWYTAAVILDSFNNGRQNGLLNAAPAWTFAAGFALFLAPALFAIRPLVKNRRLYSEIERENLAYLLLLTAIPITLALGAGYILRFYDIRYVVFCAAPYYILVARGISSVRAVSPRWALAALALLYSARSLRANYFVPYKEDYKSALAYMAGHYQAGNCAVIAQPWQERQARWAWLIYEGSRAILRSMPVESSLSNNSGCDTVWLVSVCYRWDPLAMQTADAARSKLAKRFVRVESKRFFWIDIDQYAVDGRSNASALF